MLASIMLQYFSSLKIVTDAFLLTEDKLGGCLEMNSLMACITLI